jgi:hypothetical protein
MATLKASFHTLAARAPTGSTIQAVGLSGAVRLANLTTSGSSQILQAVGGGDFVTPSAGVLLLTADGDLNVVAGSAPVAAATAGAFLTTAFPYTFTVDAGVKIAAIDA